MSTLLEDVHIHIYKNANPDAPITKNEIIDFFIVENHLKSDIENAISTLKTKGAIKLKDFKERKRSRGRSIPSKKRNSGVQIHITCTQLPIYKQNTLNILVKKVFFEAAKSTLKPGELHFPRNPGKPSSRFMKAGRLKDRIDFLILKNSLKEEAPKLAFHVKSIRLGKVGELSFYVVNHGGIIPMSKD